jgi:hypothetical protein
MFGKLEIRNCSCAACKNLLSEGYFPEVKRFLNYLELEIKTTDFKA